MRAKVIFDEVSFNFSIGGSPTSQKCDFTVTNVTLELFLRRYTFYSSFIITF
jgi:hypothetical protein